MGDVDVKKALVSNDVSFCEKNYKYFIGYLYNDNKVKLWCHKASQPNGQPKWVYFVIEDDYLLEKHKHHLGQSQRWYRKKFDSELVYNKKLFENQNKISCRWDFR